MPTDTDTDRPLIAVAVLASFVAFLDGSVVNLALPAIGREFGGGLALQQWVVDGYLLTLGALILVAGAVSDQFGRLSVLRMGIVVFGVASLLCAVAPGGWVLVGRPMPAGRRRGVLGAQLARDDQRAVLGGRAVPRDRHVDGVDGHGVRDRPAARRRARRRGGMAVDLRGQHRAAGRHAVPDDQAASRASSPRTAPRASTTSAPHSTRWASPARCTRSSRGSGWASRTRRSSSAWSIGVGCLIAFPWWERRAPHPMMPLHIFAARNFAVGNLATVFLYAGVSLGMLVTGLFLQETAGLSATQAGLATLPIPVLSFFLARRFGTLAGVHGPRLFMAVGPLIAALGYLWMLMAREPFNFWTQMLPGLVVFGLGLSITVSPLTAAILAAVDPAQSGIGSAVNNAVSRISGLIAIAFTGVIIGGAVDFAGFRQGALVTAALFAVAGVVSAVGIRNAQCDFDRVTPEDAAGCLDRVPPPPAYARR